MTPDRTRFQRAVADWRLGRRPIEELPRAALDALTAGQDSPALAELAGMENASWSEIKPVLERVVAEMGGPSSETEARVVVADDWLRRVAGGALDPGACSKRSFTEDVLGALGGDYAWFRRAIYDLDILDALEDAAGRERAVAEVRERAATVLQRPVDARLAAPATGLEEGVFVKSEPIRGRRLNVFRWRRRS